MPSALIEQISGTIGKTKVVALSRMLQDQNINLAELIDITLYPDKGIAFRAAWLLENILLDDPVRFSTYIDYCISKFKLINNPGCKRHYAKILMHITAPNALPAVQQQLLKLNLEPAVEQCFDWLIDPKVLVAVKAFASEALFNLRHRYPWIKEELPEQLEYLMRDGSAAIQSKGKRLLNYLQPEKISG